MVCEETIKNLERQMKRKLTEKERRQIKEKMHHSCMEEREEEEVEVCA